MLRSKDGNGKRPYRDSDVKLPGSWRSQNEANNGKSDKSAKWDHEITMTTLQSPSILLQSIDNWTPNHLNFL
ncbi:hypothetical protein FOPE_06060 [Fonsecaea pedrosoi]|nr:hypothetical protein FOPE_06060 [Fonsecaea pedrosoi]